jgi:hypothetical protein
MAAVAGGVGRKLAAVAGPWEGRTGGKGSHGERRVHTPFFLVPSC